MKIFIGALVGAIIIFIFQFLSWGVLNLHYSQQQYTPKQDSMMAYLNAHLDSSGGYMMPNLPQGYSQKDMKELDANMKGKPWAQIIYHSSYNANMGVNMIKNLVINFIMVLLFCWILAGFTYNSFGKTFIAALMLGFIIFLHSSYTEFIWYQTFDLYAHLADFLISWGLTGIWLGWWMNRKK